MSENEKLIEMLESRKNQEFDNEAHMTNAEADAIISELKSPTKASLEKCAEALDEAMGPIISQPERMERAREQRNRAIKMYAKAVLDAADVDYEEGI